MSLVSVWCEFGVNLVCPHSVRFTQRFSASEIYARDFPKGPARPRRPLAWRGVRPRFHGAGPHSIWHRSCRFWGYEGKLRCLLPSKSSKCPRDGGMDMHTVQRARGGEEGLVSSVVLCQVISQPVFFCCCLNQSQILCTLCNDCLSYCGDKA